MPAKFSDVDIWHLHAKGWVFALLRQRRWEKSTIGTDVAQVALQCPASQGLLL
jgi:hypothetical protein